MIERRELIAKALRLEWITLGWMLIEAAVAIGSGIIAHSLTLIAFGADSVIELASACVVIRRLAIELRRGEAVAMSFERRAARIGSVLLFALSGYVVVSAGWSLWMRTGQEFSIAGLVLAVIAIPLMFGLARMKAHIADLIGSRALRADAAEAIACGYLSAVVVVGLIAQGLIGAWWIDGLSALALTPLLFREALEAWETMRTEAEAKPPAERERRRAQPVRDPVCGMSVDPATAHHHAEYAGERYYFCGARCRERFTAEPERFLAPSQSSPMPAAGRWTCPMHPEIVRDGPGACPICGMALEPMTPAAVSLPVPASRPAPRA